MLYSFNGYEYKRLGGERMKLKILEFRAHMAYRLAIITDKVFQWFAKRHHELYKRIEEGR